MGEHAFAMMSTVGVRFDTVCEIAASSLVYRHFIPALLGLKALALRKKPDHLFDPFLPCFERSGDGGEATASRGGVGVVSTELAESEGSVLMLLMLALEGSQIGTLSDDEEPAELGGVGSGRASGASNPPTVATLRGSVG